MNQGKSGDFTTLSEKAVPSVSPIANSNALKQPDSAPHSDLIKTAKLLETPKQKLNYGNSDLENIPENDPDALLKNHLVPNVITVIYHNDANVRINLTSHDITSNKTNLSNQVNEILNEYNVLSKGDLSAGMSDQQIEADYSRTSQYFEDELPDRRSFHVYRFPEKTNIIGVLKKLRTLPFVRCANPVVEASVATYTKSKLSDITVSTTGTAPSDPDFAFSESGWWWFNRQKILNAWTEYASTTMPTIAVVDDGFDTSASPVDAPTFISGGQSITGCSNVGTVYCSLSSTLDSPVGEPWSHGQLVASVAASPKNNGVALAGVAPGANILPLKVDAGNTFSIATAIRQAAANSSVDVINVSIAGSGNQCPLPNIDSVVRTEVASAMAAGKIVVFAAGNGNNSIDYVMPHFYCNNIGGDGGSIVVGGAQNDTTVGRMARWDDSFFGSVYDTTNNTIDIAAAAQNITGGTYNTVDGRRYTYTASGTSLAAPMVSAVAGMVKKLAAAQSPSLTLGPLQVEQILVDTSDVFRSTPGYTSGTENKFVGRDLSLSTSADAGGSHMVGIRSLNAFNAMIVAKNLNKHQVLFRTYNNDDDTWGTVNANWSPGVYMLENYGHDSIWGMDSLVSGDTLDSATYNSGAGGGYAYGRSLMKWSSGVLYDYSLYAGVSGVSGAEYNAGKAIGWYGYLSAYY